VDGRHKRRDRTSAAITRALERLQCGQGTHPKHAGIRVRLTKQAVAREAHVSPATLYRYPELIAMVSDAIGPQTEQFQRSRPSEQRRKRLVDKVAMLEHERALLLAENFRLTRELAKHDPTLGISEPVQLDSKRSRRAPQ